MSESFKFRQSSDKLKPSVTTDNRRDSSDQEHIKSMSLVSLLCVYCWNVTMLRISYVPHWLYSGRVKQTYLVKFGELIVDLGLDCKKRLWHLNTN